MIMRQIQMTFQINGEHKKHSLTKFILVLSSSQKLLAQRMIFLKIIRLIIYNMLYIKYACATYQHVKCSGLRARRENSELSLRTPQLKQLLIHAAEECHTWQASWLRKPVLNRIATGLTLKAKNAHEQHLPTSFTWESIFYAAKKYRLQIQRYFEWNHVCHLKRF